MHRHVSDRGIDLNVLNLEPLRSRIAMESRSVNLDLTDMRRIDLQAQVPLQVGEREPLTVNVQAQVEIALQGLPVNQSGQIQSGDIELSLVLRWRAGHIDAPPEINGTARRLQVTF